MNPRGVSNLSETVRITEFATFSEQTPGAGSELRRRTERESRYLLKRKTHSNLCFL